MFLGVSEPPFPDVESGAVVRTSPHPHAVSEAACVHVAVLHVGELDLSRVANSVNGFPDAHARTTLSQGLKGRQQQQRASRLQKGQKNEVGS